MQLELIGRRVSSIVILASYKEALLDTLTFVLQEKDPWLLRKKRGRDGSQWAVIIITSSPILLSCKF
jgi:hypothetical protein